MRGTVQRVGESDGGGHRPFVMVKLDEDIAFEERNPGASAGTYKLYCGPTVWPVSAVDRLAELVEREA
jgi:hypothetical protein